MLRIAIVCVVLATSATAAEAGACLGEDEALDGVKMLEKRAKDPKADADSYPAFCVRQVPESYPKLGKRVAAACEKILTREPKHELCIDLSVQLGHKQWGGVDLFEAVSSRKIDPWSWQHVDMTVFLLGKLGDPRAAPLLVAAWKGNLEEAAKREKKKWRSSMMAWGGWRQDAARALGAVGGAEDKPFLEEQSKATKDKFVRQACTDAMAAIDKRLATKPAAPAPVAPAPAPAPAKP
jgi:hypothetical protein